MSSGDRVIMADTLDEALAGLGRVPVASTTETVPVEAPAVHDLALSALEHYEQAQEYLQQGDWAGYGAELEAMSGDLEDLLEATE